MDRQREAALSLIQQLQQIFEGAQFPGSSAAQAPGNHGSNLPQVANSASSAPSNSSPYNLTMTRTPNSAASSNATQLASPFIPGTFSRTSNPATLPPSNTPIGFQRQAASILDETRHIFQPYPRMLPGNLRLAGRSAGARQVSGRATVEPRIRTYIQKFICLSGPDERLSPDASYASTLKLNGLGEEAITLPTQANSDDVKTAIYLAFPKLNGIEIELLRTFTGRIRKPIDRVSCTVPVPDAPTLKALRTSFYVRPLTKIPLAAEVDEEMEALPNPATDAASMAESNDSLVTDQTQSEPPSTPSSSTVQGLVGNDSHTNNLTEINVIPDEEVTSLDNIREELYAKNEGTQYIAISRGEFLERLIGIYKNPSFNLAQKPSVQFLGEAGTDIGALTREYFWCAFSALKGDKLDGKPLFEGQEDHLIPSNDARLLRTGIFKYIGKFLGHAILHCGFGFIGLSEAVVEYLFLENFDHETPLTIDIEDIPDVDMRRELELINEIKTGVELYENDQQAVQSLASSFDFEERITKRNAASAYEHILRQAVIEKRIQVLNSLKTGLKSTPVYKYLLGKQYLIMAAFPRVQDVSFSPRIVLDRTKCNIPDHPLFVTFKEFVESLDQQNGAINKLLMAWTGGENLPDLSANLQVNIEDDTEFIAHACFNEIKIPTDMTPDTLKQNLNLLVFMGYSGFGAI